MEVVMNCNISESLHMSSSLIVLVIDDYSNKVVISSGLSVEVEGEKKPIRKPDGYYVFLNLKNKAANLTIRCNTYYTEKRSVDLTQLKNTDPVIKIRVKPNKYYPALHQATCLQGIGKPGCEVRVVCEDAMKHFRLLYDYNKDDMKDEIAIYNPDNNDLEGKLFQIMDKDRKHKEMFCAVKSKETQNSLYKIEPPLKNTYQKVGTKILPVFSSKTDSNGEYFIMINNINEDSAKCRCEIAGDKTITKDIILKTGKINKSDFIE
jgi:hypothetical protein